MMKLQRWVTVVIALQACSFNDALVSTHPPVSSSNNEASKATPFPYDHAIERIVDHFVSRNEDCMERARHHIQQLKSRVKQSPLMVWVAEQVTKFCRHAPRTASSCAKDVQQKFVDRLKWTMIEDIRFQPPQIEHFTKSVFWFFNPHAKGQILNHLSAGVYADAVAFGRYVCANIVVFAQSQSCVRDTVPRSAEHRR